MRRHGRYKAFTRRNRKDGKRSRTDIKKNPEERPGPGNRVFQPFPPEPFAFLLYKPKNSRRGTEKNGGKRVKDVNGKRGQTPEAELHIEWKYRKRITCGIEDPASSPREVPRLSSEKTYDKTASGENAIRD